MGGRKPVITLTEEIENKGKEIFEKHFPGSDINNIVLFHSRDSLYDKNTANQNFLTQKYRNSSVLSYLDILKFLKQKNYLIIRIGDFQKKCKYEKFYNCIDHLSQSEQRLLECYLAKYQIFFLGSNSGPFGLATIWNKPIFRLNILPYGNLRFIGDNSVSIPKILIKNNKILTIKKIYENNIHLLNSDNDFKNHNIEYCNVDGKDALEDFKIFYKCFLHEHNQNKFLLDYDMANIKFKKLAKNNSPDYFAQGNVGYKTLQKHNII